MSRIRSITIKMEAGQPVTIDVERSISDGEAGQVVDMMKSFVLIDKPEAA